jgi:hypothetical protein
LFFQSGLAAGWKSWYNFMNSRLKLTTFKTLTDNPGGTGMAGRTTGTNQQQGDA